MFVATQFIVQSARCECTRTKCSGVKGWLNTNSNFQCKKCRVNGTTSIGAASGKQEYVLIENDKSVEWFEKCCYLGDMLSCGGGAEESSSEDQVCLEEIQGAVSNTDSKRRISQVEGQDMQSIC